MRMSNGVGHRRSTRSHRIRSFRFLWFLCGLALVLDLPFLGLRQAQAAVDLVGSWSGETQFETNGFNYTPGAGSNRIALILITAESSTNPVANVNQVSLGGQTLTAIQSADGIVVGSAGSFHNFLWLGYLDETAIGNMVGNALSINWDQAPNTPNGEIMVQAATYENVDQTTPIADSASNTNTSASSIQAGNVSVGICDRLVYVTVTANPANNTAPGGYTEQLEQDGPVGDHSNASVQRDATTASTQNPTASWSITHRLAIISAVLNSGEGVLTLANHTTGQETDAFSESGSETDAELFAFELDPEADTVSVTQLVFTLSDIVALTDGDWGGIEIIVDSDDSGDIDGAESTGVGGAGVVNTGAGTITFSTAISVTAATSYILRADFASLSQGDTVTVALTTANITTTACLSGSTTSVDHEEQSYLTLSDHTAGQESDAFTQSGSETNAELFAFELDSAGDTITVTQLVFSLSAISGLGDGDWAGVEIIVDDNDDGDISGESTAVGGAGVVNTAGGTITFSTSFDVTAVTSYILRADFASLSDGDTVTIDLTTANITTTASKSGFATSVVHLEQSYLTLSDHTAGQESNAFSGSGGETNAELFAFELNPAGSTVTVTQLVFNLSDIAALSNGDWGGIEIIVDSDDSGDIDGGESTAVGGAGVVNTGAGTITFSTSFDVTAATSYILRADFSSLTQCDRVTISLATANITTTATKSGTASSVIHAEAGFIDDLVGHWKLDDGAGLTAVDSAGSNNGTLTNGPTWSDGNLCGALSFDENNDYVWASDFSYGPDFSVSFWFKVDDNSGFDFQYMFSHGDVNAANTVHVMIVEGTSPSAIIRTHIRDTNDAEVATALDVTDNIIGTGWHHYALVVEAATGSKVYLNGTQRASDATRGGDAFNPTTNIEFARRTDADPWRYYGGLLDDIRIYDDGLAVADVQALAATYKVIDLGTVGEERSYGFSINDSEQIAGYDEDSATGDTDAWLCETCAFTSIGTFAGGSVAESLGINSAGEVVGWSNKGGGDRAAFFYDGSLTDLGTLTDRDDSEATAVNASSEVVGTSLNFGAPPRDRLAFIYLPAPAYTLGAGINSLGTLGGAESVAMDINDSGQVVGGSQDSSHNMRPFRWANGVMTDLGNLGGEDVRITHRANAINSSGDVVGQSYTAGGDAHAFLYDGSMNDLGVLTGGDTSVAYDINDDDQIVGTSNVTGGDFHAFIYQDGAMADLNDLIDTNSTWALIRATGINDDGEIVGWGQNPDGDYHAFLLIQTCSGAGPPGGIAGASLLLASGSGITEMSGDFEETILDAEDKLLGGILVAGAYPDEAVSYTVTAPGPESTGAPGPEPGTFAGFAGGVALPRTMFVEGPGPASSLTVAITMSFTDQVLADSGVSPEDVELHVLDESQTPAPGVWIPAGVNIGESQPTGVVGDSGYVVYEDWSVDFWAVRDTPGIFAVGAGLAQEDPVDDEDDDDTSPNGPSLPRLCGVGMIPFSLVAVIALALTRVRRSRF